MDYRQAAELVNIIKPNIVIPTHYACIAGSIEDGYKFKELLDNNIVMDILNKYDSGSIVRENPKILSNMNKETSN